MIFACDGIQYDTGELIEYQTGDAHRPLIYATPEYATLFVVERTRDGINVHRADPADVAEIADQFGLTDLRRALRASSGDHDC